MARSSAPRHAIDISEEDGVRYLHFGSDWIQGAMRIARPWSLELDYTREMMAGLLFEPDPQWPKDILLIGLGAGSLAKFIYRNLPASRITVVEINPQVEFAARQFFKSPDDPQRLQVEIACGADFMLGGRKQYDMILVDGFDPKARMGALDTEPFFLASRARLRDSGLFGINLLGREKGFKNAVDRLRAAFDGRLAVFPSCDSGNTIAFASGGAPRSVSLDELRARAETVRKNMRLDLRPTISRLQLAHPLPDGRLTL